ncbi:hypothetical protein FSARC_9469 [Fusarium sarcochroum]|uniref:Chromo domain-containing protein n=1 Tax=Fusarium sarcochroum TaxID=1208366 RepID=A0A8H4TQV3_9HYPO|nr:hypothetical protein FSARC_9469 [Fusarium sarcochroum]
MSGEHQLVSKSITAHADDILPISVIDGAVDWEIVGHKTETREDVEIISVHPPVQGPYVVMKVWWFTEDNPKGTTGLFTERDVQGKNEELLLTYWEAEGGREEATGLDSDVAHIFKILAERIAKPKNTSPQKEFLVQFVGYSCSDDDTMWWPAEDVEKTYLELYEDWTFKKEQLDD